jgi:hypothetical protein
MNKKVWPLGQYEVWVNTESWGEEERLNGFHTLEEAQEAAESFKDLDPVVLDRADKFCYGPDDKLQML